MPGYKIVGRKQIHETGAWTATVDVGGQKVRCQLVRGNRVRVAFKPRNFVGFKWYAYVVVDGKTVWSEEVTKSVGIVSMLEAAGLIDRGRCGRLLSRSLYFGGYASHCPAIKPKDWTGHWCPRCTRWLEDAAREPEAIHFERAIPAAEGRFGYTRLVTATDDAAGRWEDDGGAR